MFLSVLLKQVQVLEAPDRFPCVLCMFVSFPFDQILPLSSELLMFEYSFDFVFLHLEFWVDLGWVGFDWCVLVCWFQK